jgi:peroxiredoxin
MIVSARNWINIARGIWIGVWVMLAMPVSAALPAPGSEPPDFTLASSTGRNVRLKELRGQVVLINFWATWCGPCRQEMPLLNRLHERYHKTGFALLGVNIDDKSASAEIMARKLDVRFPLLFDTNKRVSRLYDVDAMPSTLIVDRDGKVRYVHRGFVPGVERKYEEQIRALLKE